jgi:hypothetical protein
MRNKDIDIGNLFFLLSIAPLAAGCPSDDTGETEGATGTSTGTGSTSIEPPPGDSTTAAVDDTGTGTTSDATSSSAGPEDTGTSTSADTSSSSGGESSSSSGGESSSSSGGESSSSSGGESSSTTGSGQTPCEAYAAQIALCYGDPTLEPIALMYCSESTAYYGMQYGAVCVAAFEDFLVCISNLSCMELMSGMPVCPAEGMALQMECV